MSTKTEKFLVTYRTLGRQNLATRLGTNKRTISAAMSVKRFPAAWFAVIAEMCAERQIECPLEIFSFHQAEQIAARCSISLAVSHQRGQAAKCAKARLEELEALK